MGNPFSCTSNSRITALTAKAAKKLEKHRGPMLLDPNNLYIYHEGTLFFTQGLSAKCIIHLSEFLYVRFNVKVSSQESSSFCCESRYIPMRVRTVATPYFVYEDEVDLHTIQNIIKKTQFCDEIQNYFQQMKFAFTFSCDNIKCTGTKTLKMKLDKNQKDGEISSQFCRCVDAQGKLVTKYPWASTLQKRFVDYDQVIIVHSSQFAFFDTIRFTEDCYASQLDNQQQMQDIVYALSNNKSWHGVVLTEKNINNFWFFQWKSAPARTGRYTFAPKQKKFYDELTGELEMALYEERILNTQSANDLQVFFTIMYDTSSLLTIQARCILKYSLLILQCLNPIIPGADLPFDMIKTHAMKMLGIRENDIKESRILFAVHAVHIAQHRECTFARDVTTSTDHDANKKTKTQRQLNHLNAEFN